jgi:hypothetical protein
MAQGRSLTRLDQNSTDTSRHLARIYAHIARISTSETMGASNANCEGPNMNGNRYYGVRVEGAKYGVGFGSALAIAISYTANHSILWAIIHGILGWLYVIYFALFRS